MDSVGRIFKMESHPKKPFTYLTEATESVTKRNKQKSWMATFKTELNNTILLEDSKKQYQKSQFKTTTMLKQIYLELIRNGVNPRDYTMANDVEETDGQINLQKDFYIQIGDSYLVLWQSIESGEKLLFDVNIDQIDNTIAVKQFINKVKQH